MTHYVFILSTGRTGTQFLARFFDANYDSTLSVHEPKPSYHLRVLSNAYAARHAPKQLSLGVLRRSRHKLLDGLTKEFYIESNNFIYGFVDLLPEFVAQPTILHVIRDPREFVSSSINHGSWSGKKLLASKLVPYWFPNVRPFLKQVRRPTAVGILAAKWVYVNQLLRERGESYPRYRLYRYEDVFREPYDVLKEICGLIGLPYPSGEPNLKPSTKLNKARLGLIGRWDTWTDAQCREFQAVCGSMMQEYGYGQEPGWLSRVS